MSRYLLLLSVMLAPVEVILSIVVHLSFGLLLLSYAVVCDIILALEQSMPSLTKQCKRLKLMLHAATERADHKLSQKTHNARPETVGQLLQSHELEEAPVVLVHGIFGFGDGKLGCLSYWGGAEKMHTRVFVPDLGPLTSLHDRACELFYFLKGGTVDYGLEHAKRYGHARFGRTYLKGHYSEWDDDHPIHFVAHSVGAQVVRVLQQMLADKRFEGHGNTSADWVLSVTCLSGALNGTTRVYIDGIRSEDGKSVKSISLLQFLRLGVLLYEWLDIPALKKYYSFGFDHYHLGWHSAGFKGLAKTMLDLSGPFASGDWILPDLSVHQSIKINSNLQTHSNTYYLSYATKKTRQYLGRTLPSAMLGIHPIFLVRTWQISVWRHPLKEMPLYAGYKDEEWHDNDGAVNTFSMLYPRIPDEHRNCHMNKLADGQIMKPGIWYYTILEADHIFFIINRERAGIYFDVLYKGIFDRCRKQWKRMPAQRIACKF